MAKPSIIHLPNGDAVLSSLIGSCAHYNDSGIMILSIKGDKLHWVTETDNQVAKTLRDEIVAKMTA